MERVISPRVPCSHENNAVVEMHYSVSSSAVPFSSIAHIFSSLISYLDTHAYSPYADLVARSRTDNEHSIMSWNGPQISLRLSSTSGRQRRKKCSPTDLRSVSRFSPYGDTVPHLTEAVLCHDSYDRRNRTRDNDNPFQLGAPTSLTHRFWGSYVHHHHLIQRDSSIVAAPCVPAERASLSVQSPPVTSHSRHGFWAAPAHRGPHNSAART